MWNEQWKEENEIFHERHDLTIERIRMIGTEQTAAEQFRPYFRHVAEFLLFVEEVRAMVEDGSWEKLSFDEMKEINHKLYADISEENYGTSYANPAWAVEKLGEDFGTFLSFLYTEMRAQIGYAYEGKLKYNTICNELLLKSIIVLKMHSVRSSENLRRSCTGMQVIIVMCFWQIGSKSRSHRIAVCLCRCLQRRMSVMSGLFSVPENGSQIMRSTRCVT